MKTTAFRSTLLLLTLLFLSPLSAQEEELKVYLGQTDPIIVTLQDNIKSFVDEVQPLREKSDFIGLKSTADKYIAIWDGMLEELSGIQPPEDAGKHYQALQRLLELQKESNQILSETLHSRISVLLEVKRMREANAPTEEIEAFVQDNTLDRDALIKRTTAVKNQTKEADATLKSERDRLLKAADVTNS